ncbi:MAG: hypothetical protein K5906_03840 [Bacilli bacterium]|nr:hypothetical protein [Bacilli bacterium]
MRKIYILTTLILTLLININTSLFPCEALDMNGYSVSYESQVFEPLNEYFSINISGKVKINSGASNSNLRLRYELYSNIMYGLNKYYAYGYAGSAFAYPNIKEINYSFNLKDINNVARENVLIRFGIYDRTNKKYVNYIESNINTEKENIIDISSVDGDLVYNTCLCLAERDVSETFNFSNFSEYLELNTYHYLDLSSYTMFYRSYKDFNLESSDLIFNDVENIFPYIPNNPDDELKHIPLYPYFENNYVTFKFKDLYVKPETLEMALEQKEGFSKTNYFYLPKNKLNKLQGFPFYLRVKKAGINHISFTSGFVFSPKSLLLGPCNISNFCIVGGVKND